MIRKTKGIVLHTTRYGESSLVVHCYTEEFGRQSYMIKGVRKSRKQNRSNLFQPLFLLDFEVYHKDSREIQLVKEATRSIPLNSIPFDVTKSTQAIFIAEVLYRVVKEEEQNPMLSHFLVNSIKYLDALEDPSPDFHIVFLFQLSRYLGFYPQKNFNDNYAPIFPIRRCISINQPVSFGTATWNLIFRVLKKPSLTVPSEKSYSITWSAISNCMWKEWERSAPWKFYIPFFTISDSNKPFYFSRFG